MIGISKEQSEVLKNAIKTFGERNQEDIAIEEMAELTKEIIKNRRYGKDYNRSNILEEIVDVQIMLLQLVLIYGFNKDVFDRKIDRLNRRITATKCEINQNIESCEECGFCSNNGEIKKINEITQEIIEAIEKKTYESMPFNEISITEINNHCIKTIKELCDMGYITVKEDVNKIYINNENVDDIDFLCCLPLAFPEMDKKIYTVNINGKDIGQVEYYGLLEQDKESGIYNIGYNMTFKYHEPIESLCVSFEIGGENNA